MFLCNLTQPSWTLKKKGLNGLFFLLNIRHPKKLKPFSQDGQVSKQSKHQLPVSNKKSGKLFSTFSLMAAKSKPLVAVTPETNNPGFAMSSLETLP